MATQSVEKAIVKAVEKSAPYAAGMIAGWIRDSITANDYMVIEMKQAKFTFTSNDKMKFTALVKAHIGKDFVESTIAKMVWVKTGDKFKREFVNV